MSYIIITLFNKSKTFSVLIYGYIQTRVELEKREIGWRRGLGLIPSTIFGFTFQSPKLFKHKAQNVTAIFGECRESENGEYWRILGYLSIEGIINLEVPIWWNRLQKILLG